MLRLIRRVRSGRYWSRGKWTRSARRAEAFPDTASALAHIRQKQLRQVEIVLKFGKTPSGLNDITLRVASAGGHGSRQNTSVLSNDTARRAAAGSAPPVETL